MQQQPPKEMQMIKYGNMTIPSKLVIYQKTNIYAMIPLAPKLNGHVMIIPKRQVLNFKDLKPAEVFDIGLAIRLLSKELEKFHNCTSTTVYIKNYSRTDDKINHVTVHLVTRKKGDLANNDEIYTTLDAYDRDFMMEYNTSIANSDVFSDTKIEQLGLMAFKYKAFVDKALLEMKNQI